MVQDGTDDTALILDDMRSDVQINIHCLWYYAQHLVIN